MVYNDNDALWQVRMFWDQLFGEWHDTWMAHKVITENMAEFEACLQSIGRLMHEEVLSSVLAHKLQLPNEPIINTKIRDEWSISTIGKLQLMVLWGHHRRSVVDKNALQAMFEAWCISTIPTCSWTVARLRGVLFARADACNLLSGTPLCQRVEYCAETPLEPDANSKSSIHWQRMS